MVIVVDVIVVDVVNVVVVVVDVVFKVGMGRRWCCTFLVCLDQYLIRTPSTINKRRP